MGTVPLFTYIFPNQTWGRFRCLPIFFQMDKRTAFLSRSRSRFGFRVSLCVFFENELCGIPDTEFSCRGMPETGFAVYQMRICTLWYIANRPIGISDAKIGHSGIPQPQRSWFVWLKNQPNQRKRRKSLCPVKSTKTKPNLGKSSTISSKKN